MNWPLYRLETEPLLATEGNRGLWYNRFFNCYGADWKIPDTGKSQWVSGNAGITGQREILQAQSLRHLALITALGGRGAVFATDWHFASGLGLPHPVENGLAWHHTLGVPYLAGSGVKGLVKAWVEVWDESLNEEEKKRRLMDWFGTTEQAGRFRFFDALPVEPVTLAADVMTPHMDQWYEQGAKIGEPCQEPQRRVPADWHDPVPVPFLVVKNAKLLFGIAPRRPEFAGELSEVFAALKQALDWLGAGAKTAAGYGRMMEHEGATADLREKAEQARAQAAEAKLSPEQRALHVLRSRLEADQKRGVKEAGGELINQTNQLLKDGLNWPVPDREELAKLAEAIFGYVGWGAKKKERKEKIAALRR
ncbi:type III-B CRISPR module RAMP protein Cmr6 [Candidatus Contendibacter odensensis]|uniref:CRISPR-associated RAMP protein, Cmr6 family n=1 Tax=Candidatus Contendobacter odensis Run_B_J11 TaxID=1400861 RepID=A0A7U7GDN5_9GAMM